METNLKQFVEEVAKTESDQFLHEDSYYEYIATPLKSAETLKAEEKAFLSNYLQFKEIQEQIETAESLIRENLSLLVPQENFEAIITQFDEAPLRFQENLAEYIKKAPELALSEEEQPPVFLQNLCGFSHETLIDCYKLAQDLASKKQFQNACAILVFLRLMAPYVSSYWFAYGLCSQALINHTEAIEAFLVASAIEPESPEILYALAGSYNALGESQRFQNALQQLKALISSMDKEQQIAWQEKIKRI